VTLVQVTRAWKGGASLSSGQQPLLQGLGDKLIGKNALKDDVGHLPLALVDVDGVVVDDAGESLETAVKGGRVEVLVVTALEVLGHHVLLEAELGSVVQVEGVDVVVEQHGLLLQLGLVTELSLPPSPLAHDGGGGEESPEGGQAERDEESQSSQGQESTEKSASSSAVVLLLALSLLVDIDRSSTASPSSTSVAVAGSSVSTAHTPSTRGPVATADSASAGGSIPTADTSSSVPA